MNVFSLRERVVAEYASFARSFISIRDTRILEHVERSVKEGLLWPEPLIQLNPSYERAETVEQLVQQGLLHEGCGRIFRIPSASGGTGSIRLHRHQAEAIRSAAKGRSYVLTTGTGSGKSLAFMIPIVDLVLREGSGGRVKAIVVYPMNALANSQVGELEKFLSAVDPKDSVTFARYTGQENDEERQKIIAVPPDILLTNYVMLELLLTRPYEKQLIRAAQGLRFLVFDELHTYRGRQGADVSLLIRRTRDALAAERLQCVGTSATIAATGDSGDRGGEVATVASLIFGTDIQPEDVIGETLRRATPELDFSQSSEVAALKTRLAAGRPSSSDSHAEFVSDPLSSWVESTFGVLTDQNTGALTKATPRGLSGEYGAVKELSGLVDLPQDVCAQAIQEHLLTGYGCMDPGTGSPVFPFRLHQFISRGDTVYATLEPEGSRYLTVHGQQYVPNDRSRALFPLAFCRACGQEYYTVRQTRSKETGLRRFVSREFSDRQKSDEDEACFIYLSTEEPWPSETDEVLKRVPEDWLEVRETPRVKSHRRGDLPRPIRVAPSGEEDSSGLDVHWFPSFHFCLRCGVSYAARGVRSDFAKLGILGSEGRSSATTVLSLASIRGLRQLHSLPSHARKLLSFTDNRQDASLQAGHFNDFVEVVLLRSALYRSAKAAGADGIPHEILTQSVFDALDLPIELYAADPEVRFAAREDAERAFREVLGYRLYRDLRRGWRITCPNLEQTGLLEIRYRSLEELCQSEEDWEGLHPALVCASPEERIVVSKTLLDYMRRE
ncbi:MAG: DEAD/DEAH box helicase, partial [Gammaproteobacteria bacterium]